MLHFEIHLELKRYISAIDMRRLNYWPTVTICIWIEI